MFNQFTTDLFVGFVGPKEPRREKHYLFLKYHYQSVVEFLPTFKTSITTHLFRLAPPNSTYT